MQVQDPIQTVTDTGLTVAVTHEEVTLGPITNPNAASHHATEAQAHTATDETPHTADLYHAEVFSRDHSMSRPCTSHKHHHKTAARPSYSSDQTTWKTKDRKHKQVTIDDPPSEYYSSDEQASESDDDLN